MQKGQVPAPGWLLLQAAAPALSPANPRGITPSVVTRFQAVMASRYGPGYGPVR